MKNIVGQVASKENFYPRVKEIRNIMRLLDAGANIQLSAPRRVGKSSILIYLKDNPVVGYHFVYIDVESARDLQNFYRKIYKEILKSDVVSTIRRIKEQFREGKNKFFSKLKNVKLGSLGEFELNEDEVVDYEEELINFLSGVDLDNKKLVIMVDEFPEVILNNVQDNNGDFTEARTFLQSNRALRNNDVLRGRVQFIYTGSSSLNTTAEALKSTELINDIAAVPVGPLSETEAKDLVRRVLEEYEYNISENELNFLVLKVEWLIPFYFQLAIHEIINLVDSKDEITEKVIFNALEQISTQRNDHHFEHYVKRLRRIFPEGQYKFIQVLLNYMCQVEKMTKDEILNSSHGIVPEIEVRGILSSLINDGYLVMIPGEDRVYKFNSSIFKKWWYNHEC
jgi:hypothetical protein